MLCNNSIIQNEISNKTAADFTHESKIIGNGNMFDAFKNVATHAYNEGQQDGYKKGQKDGALKLLGACGIFCLTKRICCWAKNKVKKKRQEAQAAQEAKCDLGTATES